jgi:muramoyltetrapeptide carboxypeptidase LdcA involved in peptidoglycan recycling
LVTEAVQESNQQQNMAMSRKHAEKMKLNTALERLASKGHMVVSGQNGQQVLNFFNNTIDQISKN